MPSSHDNGRTNAFRSELACWATLFLPPPSGWHDALDGMVSSDVWMMAPAVVRVNAPSPRAASIAFRRRQVPEPRFSGDGQPIPGWRQRAGSKGGQAQGGDRVDCLPGARPRTLSAVNGRPGTGAAPPGTHPDSPGVCPQCSRLPFSSPSNGRLLMRSLLRSVGRLMLHRKASRRSLT